MDNLNQYFKQYLGRDASPDELGLFRNLISEGTLQPGEVGTILQSYPDYQRQLLEQNTQAFGQQLNQQNQAIINQAAATANSRFAGLGRPTTSALGASVLQAGGQLAQSRQAALSDFYGRGLQQNMSLSQGLGQSQLERAYRNRDTIEAERRAYGYQLDAFNRMRDLQQDQMNASNRSIFTAPGMFKAGLSIAGNAAASYVGGRAGRSSQTGGF